MIRFDLVLVLEEEAHQSVKLGGGRVDLARRDLGETARILKYEQSLKSQSLGFLQRTRAKLALDHLDGAGNVPTGQESGE